MNSTLLGGWGWALLSVLANVCASTLLKIGARASVSDLIAFKDPGAAAVLAGALAAYGAAFVAYFLTLRQLPVSLAYVVPVDGDCQPTQQALDLEWYTPAEAVTVQVRRDMTGGQDRLIRLALAHVGVLP